MDFNQIIRPSVGARFIAPTADLSAFAGFPDIRIKKLICIIEATADYAYYQLRSGIRTHCRGGSGADAGWGRLRRPRPPCGSITAFGC